VRRIARYSVSIVAGCAAKDYYAAINGRPYLDIGPVRIKIHFRNAGRANPAGFAGCDANGAGSRRMGFDVERTSHSLFPNKVVNRRVIKSFVLSAISILKPRTRPASGAQPTFSVG